MHFLISSTIPQWRKCAAFEIQRGIIVRRHVVEHEYI